MAELEKVIRALENCTAHPKCRDCGWKECEYEHETVEIPLTLAKDAHDLLKAQDAGWISVKERLPEDDRTVLAVKQLKDGRRDMCLARCIPDWEYYDAAAQITRKKPYWVCGGNNNIIYWMPLPEMPKEG